MLSSKERSELLSAANASPAIFQIGKGGVSDVVVKELDDAIRARELIKISVLPAAGKSAAEIMRELAPRLNAEPVRAIGRKIILYRRSEKK